MAQYGTTKIVRPAGGNVLLVNCGQGGFVRSIVPNSNDGNLVTLSAQRYVVFRARTCPTPFRAGLGIMVAGASGSACE